MITTLTLPHPVSANRYSADKRRLDVTNAVKVAEDALQGLAYHDDKQVVSCTGRLGKPMAGGGLTVRIKTI